MRRSFLLILILLLTLSVASADEYFELRPGLVSSLFEDGVGFYRAPTFDGGAQLRIGPGVSMYLDELLDNGWASVRFLSGTDVQEGYVRTGSLVMNDYGLGGNVVRLVGESVDRPISFFKEPSEKAEIHGQYFTGTLFSLYEVRDDGFARVALGKLVGYIPAKYLFAYNSREDSALPAAIISHPSQSGSCLTDVAFSALTSPMLPITQYPNGTKVAILGITPDNRCHVMIDGRTGYLPYSELAPAAYDPAQ